VFTAWNCIGIVWGVWSGFRFVLLIVSAVASAELGRALLWNKTAALDSKHLLLLFTTFR
jgi:hypothetical protein